MGKGISVTYDTLFEMLLREKNRAELQKLEADFLTSVAEYLKDKKAALSRERLDVFSGEEREKTEKQIRNIHTILRDLYERREKKIMELAMIKARSSSAAIDSAAMLAEERQMFEELTNLLSSFRQSTLTSVINGQPPRKQEQKQEQKEQLKAAEPPEAGRAGELKSGKAVKFTHEVPKFLGKELEIYGPFSPDAVATLPAEIADILISKGRAEEIVE